jgi:sugar-specific transcriptional regulator TrmB
MDYKHLVGIGLTLPQAKAYLELLRHESLTPPEIAKLIGEKRTNAYSVLNKLVELKLAELLNGKKKSYKAANPANLEDFVKQQRQLAQEREQQARQMLPELMQMYFKVDSEPGIRFFKGKNELKKIYDEQITSKETLYLIRSPKDLNFYGFEFMNKIRLAPAEHGVKRVGITPYLPNAPHNTPADDKKSNLQRTWCNANDYTASVEWTIFGNKVSAISFGKEGIGMIIESPQIAESMRQIFELAKKGAQTSYKHDSINDATEQ